MEQVEEQKVIEAQIRMRLQELQEDAERTKKKQALSFRYTAEDDEFVSSQPSSSVLAGTQSTYSRRDSVENYDLDLEDVMVLEAIRRSLQEQGTPVNPVSSRSTLSEAPRSDHNDPQLATYSEISPPSGFASAIAAIAEHQHMSGEVFASAYQMLQSSGILRARGSNVSTTNNSPVQWADVTPNSTSLVVREEGEGSTEWWSDEAEAGTSYAASNAPTTSLVLSENPNLPAGHFLPESFEEQMMVALALSLAEA
ncbi:hypothetical protein ACMD2_15636 [Ananas comosus]|nr:hypothetical protein ACMD2_15636 [Ananas comosus]